jgi:hypothetical protein
MGSLGGVVTDKKAPNQGTDGGEDVELNEKDLMNALKYAIAQRMGKNTNSGVSLIDPEFKGQKLDIFNK